MVRSSFRRQQYRRLCRAVASGVASLTTGVLAVIAEGAGALAVAGALGLITLALLIDARHRARLAGRSRVGARPEDEVRRALAPLEADGWRLLHSLPYRGRGDIDSASRSPRPGPRSQSRPKPGRSTHTTSPASGRWRRGCAAADAAGVAAERSRYSASCAPAAWSASRTGSWSSQSTGSWRPSERPPEPHRAPRSWRRTR